MVDAERLDELTSWNQGKLHGPCLFKRASRMEFLPTSSGVSNPCLARRWLAAADGDADEVVAAKRDVVLVWIRWNRSQPGHPRLSRESSPRLSPLPRGSIRQNAFPDLENRESLERCNRCPPQGREPISQSTCVTSRSR